MQQFLQSGETNVIFTTYVPLEGTAIGYTQHCNEAFGSNV
jgi:hypothetical protein